MNIGEFYVREGDVVLLKGQTDPRDNGLHRVGLHRLPWGHVPWPDGVSRPKRRANVASHHQERSAA